MRGAVHGDRGILVGLLLLLGSTPSVQTDHGQPSVSFPIRDPSMSTAIQRRLADAPGFNPFKTRPCQLVVIAYLEGSGNVSGDIQWLHTFVRSLVFAAAGSQWSLHVLVPPELESAARPVERNFALDLWVTGSGEALNDSVVWISESILSDTPGDSRVVLTGCRGVIFQTAFLSHIVSLDSSYATIYASEWLRKDGLLGCIKETSCDVFVVGTATTIPLLLKQNGLQNQFLMVDEPVRHLKHPSMQLVEDAFGQLVACPSGHALAVVQGLHVARSHQEWVQGKKAVRVETDTVIRNEGQSREELKTQRKWEKLGFGRSGGEQWENRNLNAETTLRENPGLFAPFRRFDKPIQCPSQKQDIIFSVYNYPDPTKLAKWMRSLRETGATCDVVIFTNNASNPLTHAVMRHYGGRYIEYFSSETGMPEVEGLLSLPHMRKLHVHFSSEMIKNYKYTFVLCYLLEYGEHYSRAAFMDVRDIYFQRDPFRHAECSGLTGFTETAALLVNHRQHIYRDHYPKHCRTGWEKWKHLPPLNSGCFFADVASMVSLLRKADRIIQECGPGFDQGTFNELVYNGDLSPDMNISLFTTEHGPGAMIGNSLAVHVNAFAEVTNEHGAIYSVMHQFDRFSQLKSRWEFSWGFDRNRLEKALGNTGICGGAEAGALGVRRLERRKALSSPEEPAREKIFLFSSVLSMPKHRAQRDAIRTSWSAEAMNGSAFRTRFIVSKNDMGFADDAFQKELATEGDIVVTDTPTGFGFIIYKVKFSMEYAIKHFDFAFLFKTDDDSGICLSGMLKELHTLEPSRIFFGKLKVGRPIPAGKPIRVNLGLQQDPPHMGGAGYAVSADIASYIAQSQVSLYLHLHEDTNVGLWLLALDVNHVTSSRAWLRR